MLATWDELSVASAHDLKQIRENLRACLFPSLAHARWLELDVDASSLATEKARVQDNSLTGV